VQPFQKRKRVLPDCGGELVALSVHQMAPAAKSPKKDASYASLDANNLEFGGPTGALALMLWSHYILYYFW